jgi:hypothetical protein
MRKEDETSDNKWEAIWIFNMDPDCLRIGVMVQSDDDEFISSAGKRC